MDDFCTNRWFCATKTALLCKISPVFKCSEINISLQLKPLLSVAYTFNK